MLISWFGSILRRLVLLAIVQNMGIGGTKMEHVIVPLEYNG